MPGLIEELKRRNVFRVGVAYVVIAWVIAQVAELALDSFAAPDWVMKTLLLLLALGLPLALFFAWAFELTAEGIKKEKDLSSVEASSRSKSHRKFDYAIITVLVIAVGYFFWESRLADDPEASAQSVTASGDTVTVASDAQSDHSVAVLPFVNMSADEAQEYFSDGITEEIINALVKIPGLSVPARTSVFGFKGHQGDVREVGASLGVAHVLEGSVRSQGDQVRITAQLIKVDDGFHLWSETFDRKLENIFAVQEEIAGAIAKALTGELAGLDTVPNQTRNMAAYDTYLQGRAALRKRDESAITFLQQATEADPSFAPAWAALAIAYQSIHVSNDKAMVAADKALALDPDNVDALNAKGGALRHQRRWTEAEEYFNRALTIDPNSAELLEDYAEFLAYVGRTEEALAVTTRGMEIDPNLGPLVSAHLEALLSNERGDEAHVIVTEIQAEDKRGDAYLWWWAGLAMWENPSPEAALLEDPAPPPMPEDGQWFAELRSLGLRILKNRFDEDAIANLRQRYESNPNVTRQEVFSFRVVRDLLMHAGEVDPVIAADIDSLEDPAAFMPEGIWQPFNQAYRQHPRFTEYLQRAGIIAYWDATEWPRWCKRDAQANVSCH